MLVFVPLDRAGLAAWATGRPPQTTGVAATASFLDAFGLPSPDDEDAERTLLAIASLAGLLSHGVRLVAVAEAGRPERDEPADFGAVQVSALPWRAVSALFADEPASADAVAAAASELAGAALPEAWDHPAAEQLLTSCDLLWHGSAEFETLSG